MTPYLLGGLMKKIKDYNMMLKENLKDSASYRWNKKKILSKYVYYDGSTLEGITKSNDTNMSICDYSLKGESLHIVTNTNVENIKPRPNISLMFHLDDKAKKKIIKNQYNRIAVDVFIKAEGYTAFYFQFSFGSNLLDNPAHNPALIPNKWNHVIWEIADCDLNNDYIRINPWLTGTPPEATPNYEIFIDNITFEKVDADYVLGWDSFNISYCHSGYYLNDKKVAFTSKIIKKCSLFKGKEEILTKDADIINSPLGTYYSFDFSEINIPGDYYIVMDGMKTNLFEISDNPYHNSIIKSLNFLKSLRCGEYVEGVHSACHLNCRTYNELGETVPNFGGWHDAGDVSQFEIPTAEITDSLVELSKNPVIKKDKKLERRIIDEARIGAEWLLRTRFHDGSRAMAVTYSTWRDNVLKPDNKTVLTNPSENGPFENFLAASALANFYLVYQDIDNNFAGWAKRTAILDFKEAKEGYEKGIYTKRWGPSIPSQTLGQGIYAATLLYEATGDNKYLDLSKEYAEVVMACQEKGDKVKELPGFFYEDVNHQYPLCYEHRGHEQSAIQGLIKLAGILKDDKDYSRWMECIKLYASFIKKSMKYTAPYNLLPAGVYLLDGINLDRYTIPANYSSGTDDSINQIKNQIINGIKLNDNAYLRIFPVAIQRRGFHATMLSKCRGVSLVANLLDDDELRCIAFDQIKWVLGNNPFSSSTMYGEGYNYHPLYVAFSNQMVGSLPVGIMTKGDLDEPFWPIRTNAVYKEIWGHTTAKYLYVLADLMKDNDKI